MLIEQISFVSHSIMDGSVTFPWAVESLGWVLSEINGDVCPRIWEDVLAAFGPHIARCRVVQGYVWFQILFILQTGYIIRCLFSIFYRFSIMLMQTELRSLGVHHVKRKLRLYSELGERATGIQISENFLEN